MRTTQFLLACGLLLLAGSGFAHHPTIKADAVCETGTGTVFIDYVSTAWETSDASSRENPQIDILFDEVVVASGAYEAPDYSFSGSQPAPAGAEAGDTVLVTAIAVGTWGSGTGPGDFRETTVAIPDDCVTPDPGIELTKEVSVDGGETFFDANDEAKAPTTTVGGGALYQITMTNTGNVDLTNVVVSDSALEVIDFAVGDLAAGQTVVLTSGEIPALEVAEVCREPGVVKNVASVDGEPVDGGDAVGDKDPAYVRCGEPAIRIVKEVSVDGGETFFDANDEATAPITTVGGGALYQITVTNTGTVDLVDVVVNDSALDIVDFAVGDLAAGQTVVLRSGEIPALEVAEVCLEPGVVKNVASVDGEPVDGGDAVGDKDPAYVRCGEPAIRIVKEVSVDGGVTFFDANDEATAPITTVGGGALYQFTVTNTGTVDLTNVVVNDSALDIIDFAVGDLAAGQTVVLTSGEIPALEVAEVCLEPGVVKNVASVDGEPVDGGDAVGDKDPAYVRCAEPAIRIVKEVSVDGGETFFDANDETTAPVTIVGGGALYQITVTNTGTVDLNDVVVNDPTLGILDYLVGDLPVGAEVVIGEGNLDFRDNFEAVRTVTLAIPELRVEPVCDAPGLVTNIAFAEGDATDGTTVSDEDPANVICKEPPEGGQGCSPGYWKNHLASWAGTGYESEDDYETVFGVDAVFTATLLKALKQGGGNEYALGRHATAALLNAHHPEVGFAFTGDEVLMLVQEVYDGVHASSEEGENRLEALKDVFDEENNQGCPLN